MRATIQIAIVLIATVVTADSQELSDSQVEVAPTLMVSEVVISRGKVEDSEFEGMPAAAHYRIIARITNRSTKPAVNPVFQVSLDSAPLEVSASASSMLVLPDESRIFCSGGLTTTPDKLAEANTAIVKLTGDPFAFSGWDEQLEVVPKLRFQDVGFRKLPTNNFVVVSAAFQSEAEIQIARVMAIAVFLDQEGRLRDAGPISYNVEIPRPDGMMIGFPMTSVKETDQCIIQVNRFE